MNALLTLLLAAPLASQQFVTLDSKSALVQVKVMIQVGSAQDPKGKEGTAQLVGQLLTQGGFGDAKSPVTKERLAELTRPWGSGAYPNVGVFKEGTIISGEVPREFFGRYVDEVLAPMLTRPLFEAKELERMRAEDLQGVTSGLRLERIEELGLVGLDALVHDGEPYGRPDAGTESGLKAVTREDVAGFYKAYFGLPNVIVGLSSTDPALAAKLRDALAPLGKSAQLRTALPKKAPAGRRMTVVAVPNAISSGIHAGHKIAVTRTHPDFWPLYVGNIWFGTHRDGFGRLYQVFREQRGYNYGDYSYIEHFEGRTHTLFPPFNTPRRQQYFSIWIRPVGHPYVPHLLRALTWEMEELVRRGLTEQQCAEAKNKARVLYLSLAETSERLLAARVDDAFYGQRPGYLQSYLDSVEKVTCPQVNAALRNHLRPGDLQYLVVTNADEAPKIAAAAASVETAWGKQPQEYQIDVKEEAGQKTYSVPEAKLDLLRRDAVWAHHPLGLTKESVRVVPVAKMFVDAGMPR